MENEHGLDPRPVLAFCSISWNSIFFLPAPQAKNPNIILDPFYSLIPHIWSNNKFSNWFSFPSLQHWPKSLCLPLLRYSIFPVGISVSHLPLSVYFNPEARVILINQFYPAVPLLKTFQELPSSYRVEDKQFQWSQRPNIDPLGISLILYISLFSQCDLLLLLKLARPALSEGFANAFSWNSLLPSPTPPHFRMTFFPQLLELFTQIYFHEAFSDHLNLNVWPPSALSFPQLCFFYFPQYSFLSN